MSKTLGKIRSSSGTHAHYVGEFGSRRQTPELAKLPEYRSARAEHFARVAQDAAMKHASTTGADRAAHALVVEHAVKMSAKHANAAAKMTPGGEHATRAAAAHEVAKLARASLAHTEPPTTSTETRTVAAKEATKSAFAKTKIASESPNVKTQEAAAAAHREAARVNKGDDKTVALHERQAGHHQNRADAMRLGMDAPRPIKSSSGTARDPELFAKYGATTGAHLAKQAVHQSRLADQHGGEIPHLKAAELHADAAKMMSNKVDRDRHVAAAQRHAELAKDPTQMSASEFEKYSARMLRSFGANPRTGEMRRKK